MPRKKRDAIRVSLDTRTAQQAQRVARSVGVPRSTWVRMLILKALAQDTPPTGGLT
jgi:antitoxin component of RelBE/YafQ-DinJ toxin-antitoxin module